MRSILSTLSAGLLSLTLAAPVALAEGAAPTAAPADTAVKAPDAAKTPGAKVRKTGKKVGKEHKMTGSVKKPVKGRRGHRK